MSACWWRSWCRAVAGREAEAGSWSPQAPACGWWSQDTCLAGWLQCQASSSPRWCVALGWSPAQGGDEGHFSIVPQVPAACAVCLPGPSWVLGAQAQIGADVAPAFLLWRPLISALLSPPILPGTQTWSCGKRPGLRGRWIPRTSRWPVTRTQVRWPWAVLSTPPGPGLPSPPAPVAQE